MTTAAGTAAFDIARWGLLGPAGLLCALLLNIQWGGGEPGCALFLLAAVGFAAGGAMASAAIPAAGPGVAAALAATYAAGGLVATVQAFMVWSDGIDQSLRVCRLPRGDGRLHRNPPGCRGDRVRARSGGGSIWPAARRGRSWSGRPRRIW